MAVQPTIGDTSWGAAQNAFTGTSLDPATGKIKNEALQVADTAPIADAAVANKKYVDDMSIKAWIRIDGSDGSKLAGSSNVTSSRTGVGLYSLVFSPAMTDENYVVSMSASRSAGVASRMLDASQDVATPVHTTTAFNIVVSDQDKSIADAVAVDVMIMGN